MEKSKFRGSHKWKDREESTGGATRRRQSNDNQTQAFFPEEIYFTVCNFFTKQLLTKHEGKIHIFRHARVKKTELPHTQTMVSGDLLLQNKKGNQERGKYGPEETMGPIQGSCPSLTVSSKPT